jgi:formate C-acetyltransferase
MKINKEENVIKDQYFDKFVKNAKQSRFYIDTNRAVLITESYKETEGEPSIIRRAKSFKFILDNMPINIEEGELILGAQSCEPLGVLLYPEYNFRLVEEGLDSLSTRPCEPIEVSKKTKKILRERVFPYWRGKSLHEVFCDNQIYPPKDNELQGLGAIGTQGIGHIVFNPRLFIGLSNLKKEIKEKLNKSKDNSSELFYKAALISLVLILQYTYSLTR